MKNRNILSILLTSICLIPFVSCSNKPSESAPSEELSSIDSSQEQESSSCKIPLFILIIRNVSNSMRIPTVAIRRLIITYNLQN